jgi:Uma2 family endonuclease
VSVPARKKAGYEDVLNAPEHMIAEVIDGTLYTLPRPAPRHAAAASGITIDVGGFGRRRGGGGEGGWRILAEPELHLGEEIVVPDVAGWRRERMPQLPSEAYFTLPPDWVCEVISPRTARIDRTTKKRIYARHRVEWLWLVDPAARTLEVLQLADEFWQEVQLFSGDERVHPLPFEGLEVDLSLWWEGAPEDAGPEE